MSLKDVLDYVAKKAKSLDIEIKPIGSNDLQYSEFRRAEHRDDFDDPTTLSLTQEISTWSGTLRIVQRIESNYNKSQATNSILESQSEYGLVELTESELNHWVSNNNRFEIYYMPRLTTTRENDRIYINDEISEPSLMHPVELAYSGTILLTGTLKDSIDLFFDYLTKKRNPIDDYINAKY